MSLQFTPGMRLKIRDEEFALLHADPLMTGGHRLTCLGVSETVAGKEWEFLSELEKPEILHPENTYLVQDLSPDFRDSLLFIETHLRSRVSSGSHIQVGHKAAMDLMDFQLEPSRMALSQTRSRILIADTVGLGKTLEAGILVTELMARGRGKRILVVTVKSMLAQFQKEFWNRFTIPLVRMDSQGLARVRTHIPRNHNPFDYIEKSIISIDTLKNENEYRCYLEKAYWDIIVIDEAHHVSYKGSKTLSNRLADLLGGRSDTLILLSATPHNGKPESFASLMKMLDPTSVADVKRYTRDDIKGLFIRRFRKDVAHQMRGGLAERQVLTWSQEATALEEQAYQALNALRFTHLDKARSATQLMGGQMLKTVSLKKAMLSSPAACCAQIDNMLKNLAAASSPEAAADRAQLEALKEKLAAIGPEQFAKYRMLLQRLRSEWNWHGKDSADRLVIFTERIETLNFLYDQLRHDLKLPDNAVARLSGAMADVDIQQIVEDFGKERSGLRLLIASDVASEGLNLHFQSHRLIHFDIPWSLMVFQQRNGRIDRYGQTQQPLIAYLLTRYEADVMGGDVRVLELLIEKEKAAWQNIGDPATLMGQFDAEREELYTADLLLDPQALQSFAQAEVAEEPGDSLLESLLAAWSPEDQSASPAQTERTQLYSDYDFLKFGLQALFPRERFDLDLAENKAQAALSFNLPEDLDDHFAQVLPRELRPDNQRLELVGDPGTMIQKIRQSQAMESTWPEADYLWANHPVFPWLMDRLRSRRGRLQAPVVCAGDRIAGAVFLVAATHPNRRGRPVYQRLFACTCHKAAWSLQDGEAWLASLDLARRPLINNGAERDLSALTKLLPELVRQVETHNQSCFRDFQATQKADMNSRLAQMQSLRLRRVEQLELDIAGSNQPEQIKSARLRDERERLGRIFDSWQEWVRDSMTLEDKPHLQIVAVFAGEGAL